MTGRLRQPALVAELADRLEAGQPDVVLLALHVACGAAALGVTGHIDPSPPAEEVAEEARTALANGNRVGALRLCAEAMAEELPESDVERLVEALDEIRRTK